MGMMGKMRNLAPAFIIGVGGLFVLFMVISDSGMLKVLGQRSNEVGFINEEPVSYQEFSNYLQRAVQNREQQTGEELEGNALDRFRDQVWESFVSEQLIENKMQEYGISVTDQEIRDVILGENPPQFLKQNFIDSTGQFNRQMYEQAIFDPRNKEVLLQAEQAVKQQLRREKLQNYLNASVTVSEAEIRRDFVENSIRITADYAKVGINTIQDTAISVSESDLKEYYQENRDQYKVEPQRKIKYVLFEEKASSEDSAFYRENLQEIIADLEEDTSTFKTYVQIYSDESYSLDTLGMGDLSGEAPQMLMDAEEGTIIGPALTNNGYVVYNLKEKIRGDKTFANASHILVKSGQQTSDQEAKRKADSIYKALQGGADFGALAKEQSEDPGSAKRGGDLGWFGKGQMVKEFEEACFNGPVGTIQRPVKTSYGYHIIRVDARTNRQFVVERIINEIKPTPTTADKIYNKAGDFSYLANENGFEKEAKTMGYEVVESPPFKEDAFSIPGLGVSQSVINYAFTNDVGDISEVLKTSGGYVVVKISDKIKAGFKSFSEVKDQLQNPVKKEMKLEKTMDIASQIYDRVKDMGDLDIAKNVYPQANVGTAENFKVGGNIPGIGNEYAFGKVALEAEVNKVTEPFKGNQGSYLLKVTNRTQFDSTKYDIQRNRLRDQILQEKQRNYFQQWVQNLKEEAEIRDYRYRFYR
jgi:parvulin-like peptidyl-prolyl isomerase